MKSAQLTSGAAAPFRRFFGVLMIAGVLTGTVQAHDLALQSELRGRVVDPNHEAIVGARITVTRKGQVDSSTLSNANGEFSLSLDPGEYTLKIAADGFAEAAQIIRQTSKIYSTRNTSSMPTAMTISHRARLAVCDFR